ncbi:hypothetical protein ACFSQD_07035 [Flavihumibacter stibioxidans]|nr:hypothetical protein [Flavihumibacter stibioxidans]
MLRKLHTRIARHTLKLLVATVMLGFAGLAFASMGGEKRAKKSNKVVTDFVPIKTSNGFTLKAGPAYKGSITLNQHKSSSPFSFNTLVTYQKGNTTYIMPYNNRVSIGKTTNNCNNMQLLRLKVRMHK